MSSILSIVLLFLTMSSLSVVGFFSLVSGHVVKSPAPSKSTSYVHYSSAWTSSDGSSVPVDIRVFSIGDHILADYTTALIIGNFYIPETSHPILIDSTHIYPVPGDPLDVESYEKSQPDFLYPLVHVVGHVTIVSGDNDLFDNRKWFMARVSAYIRGEQKSTTIRYVFLPQCDAANS